MAKPRKIRSARQIVCAEDRRYRIENALSTLSRADEIRKDKVLMRDVARLAKEQASALGRIAGAGKKGN